MADATGTGGCVPIVAEGRAAALIVLGDQASDQERLAALELQRYVEKLARARLEIVNPTQALATGDKSLLLIGQPDNNPLVDQALGGEHDPRDLRPEGFVIHTGRLAGRAAVVISGQDGVATLYAAYALVELLGATFLLTGDLLPEPVDDLSLEATSRVWEPAFARRGLQPFINDLQDVTWGLPYFKKLIDQMVKLRMNYWQFFVQPYQPWAEYTYRGEKNLLGDLSDLDSGYLVVKRTVPSCSVKEVQIGVEHFEGWRNMAPPEMQDIQSQEEAVRRFSELIRSVLQYAKGKGMTIGFSLDPTYVAPNHARLARRYGPRPHSYTYGAHTSPNDPVAVEIAEEWLRALFETYPQIDDMYLFVSEDYDLYKDPESLQVIEPLRPLFATARQTVEDKWGSLCEIVNRTPDQVIDCDLGSLVHVKNMVSVTRRLSPGVRIGMAFFFKGFLLPSADKVVDRDIPFMDMQSSGVFPIKDDVNALYFANMGERDRYINLRVDDDGSMFGMPFYLRQYQTDGLFAAALEAGVSGFVGQVFRARGTEHHTRFLAQGAWEPELTPEAFYERYSQEIFGPAAADYMEVAFELLEETEQHLGWRGSWNFHFSGGCSELNTGFARELLRQENPFYGPPDPPAMLAEAQAREELFTRAVTLVGGALREMERAEALVSSKGEPLLRYLISKTRAYRAHLEMVVLLDQAFAAYARAFVDHAVDEPALARALDAAEQLFVAAGSKARETAERAAEFVDDPCDLGILFLANVWNVAKAEGVIGLIRRVVNYHHGRPYWEGV